jgi:hypothetical protein
LHRRSVDRTSANSPVTGAAPGNLTDPVWPARHRLQGSESVDSRTIQELLEHSSANSTSAYLRAGIGHLRKVYDRAHLRGQGKRCKIGRSVLPRLACVQEIDRPCGLPLAVYVGA